MNSSKMNAFKTIESFVNELQKIRSPHFFNPYSDACPEHDGRKAPHIRCQNLWQYLRVMKEMGPHQLWVAEAGAAHGLCRTGVPLLPEDEFACFNNIAAADMPIVKATVTPAMHSYTNAMVWKEARKRSRLPLCWNSVMGQPHIARNPYKNRAPTQDEIDLYRPVLSKLIDFFNIKQVIAIGRKAETSLHSLGVSNTYVRHPAQGGIKQFTETMRERAH